MCPTEFMASAVCVSSIHVAIDPLPVGSRAQASAVPRSQSNHAGICARQPCRTNRVSRSVACARGYDPEVCRNTWFPSSRSYCDEMSKITKPVALACLPKAHQPQTRQAISGSFLLTYAIGCALSQLHQRTSPLRPLSQGPFDPLTVACRDRASQRSLT